MQDKEIVGLIDELEATNVKTEFFDKLEHFNKLYIDKFKTLTQQKALPPAEPDKASVIPSGSLFMSKSAYPTVHTIYYVPYFPPRVKEIYPYANESDDLEYWRSKRIEFSKTLSNLS